MVNVHWRRRICDRPMNAPIDERAACAHEMWKCAAAPETLQAAVRGDYRGPKASTDAGSVMTHQRHMTDTRVPLQILHAALVRQARVIGTEHQVALLRCTQ
jgi:hypothetical protein